MAGSEFTHQSNREHTLLLIESVIEIPGIQKRHTDTAKGTSQISYRHRSVLVRLYLLLPPSQDLVETDMNFYWSPPLIWSAGSLLLSRLSRFVGLSSQISTWYLRAGTIDTPPLSWYCSLSLISDVFFSLSPHLNPHLLASAYFLGHLRRSYSLLRS